MLAPPEEKLVRQLQAARPEACEWFVRTNYAAVYRFLAHLTRDSHLAEDLTQETFATAWAKLAGFAGHSTLRTWLHRIAYRKFADAWRSRRRHAVATARLTSRQPDNMASDPLGEVMRDESERRLYDAVQALERSERVVIVCRYLHGLSLQEVAEIVDEPVGTVKWRVHEALTELRHRFELESDGDHEQRRCKTGRPGGVIT
jgi:RNA polymerase sigma-70 factor (ECF subfamily)